MASNIAPGSRVSVKIVNKPTNAGARKTLVRLLSKDNGVVQQEKRLRRARENHNTSYNRGNAVWHSRTPKVRLLTGALGETGVITASLDVLTDLKSVAKYVEVTPV